MSNTRKISFLIFAMFIFIAGSAFSSSYIINNGGGTSSGSVTYYGTGNQTAGLASQNFVANYTQINSDITTAKATGESESGSGGGGSGNVFVMSGFFVVTPTIKCNVNGCSTNYFDVCFKDSWSVSSPSGNSIFDPKIRVTNTIIFSCIGARGSATISAFGECKVLNLISRACARFAAPCQNDNNYCCNGDSCSANNSKCPGCKQESAYRICAYYDPIDLNDWNMASMPFHEKSSVPPEVTGGENIIALGALLVAAGLIVPGLGTTTVAIGLAIMLAGGIMELIEFISSTINYIVIENVGCIDVPLAPSPPPFFSSIVPSIPNASITSICQYSPEYALSSELQSALTSSGLTQDQITRLNNIQASTADALCEVGGTAAAPQYSTFENPAVRIYFSNPMPLCTGGESAVDDVCVYGKALDSPDDLQSTNLSLLPICSGSITHNCLSFPSGRTVGGPFRAYYNVQAASGMDITVGNNAPSSTPYFITNPSLQTIKVGGIDDSQYADIAAGNSVTIYDPNSNPRTFYVSLSSPGDEVCVTDKTTVNDEVSLGCVPRPIPMNPPTLTSCPNTSTCSYGSNDSIQNQPRFSVSIGSPAKSAIIGVDTLIADPDSTSNPPNNLAPQAFCVKDDLTTNGNSTSNHAPCYVYGAQYSAYITDANNTTTASSLDGNITPTYVDGHYAGGIQYSQGSYCRGATKICLTGYSNPEQQVVAKMIQVKNSATGTTQYQVSNLISDRVIPASNASLPLSSSSLFNPETGYVYSSAQPTYVAYGFLNSGQYFENTTCNSNGNACIATSNTYPSSTSCTCTNEGVSSPCNITGCEWAFLQNSPNAQLTPQGYTDGVNQYMMNDGNGNPQYGLRALNSIEQGLCADIPQPTCAAVTNPGASDGYATWPEGTAGQTVTGTCLEGTEQIGGVAPTRQCSYPDDGTTLPNGCPTPTLPSFTTINNPCSYKIPTWWPSEFLYGNTKLKGAIINHFNVTPDYMNKLKATNNNYPQVYLSGGAVRVKSVEDWIDSNTINSCKDYGSSGVKTSNVARSKSDADQEMLFISRTDWRNIWSKDWNNDGYSDDMTWLLDSTTSNNGCYVYNVNSYVTATISGIVVGLKICKYNNKISFALVDLTSGKTDYTNTDYLMQSNLIYYDLKASENIGYDHQLQAQTLVANSASSANAYYINNGFVVDTTGFNNSFSGQLDFANPPSGFVSIQTAESVEVNYALASIYKFDTSKNDYEKYTNFVTGSGTLQGSDSYSNPTYYNLSSCALSVYRSAVDYSTTPSNTAYFSFPSTSINRYPSGKKNYPSTYRSPFISSLYVYTQYNGGNSESDWPYSDNCQMKVRVRNFVKGNSAMNPSMFLWSSPTSYNVCNP